MKKQFFFFPAILFAGVFTALAGSTNAVYWNFYTTASPASNSFSGLAVSDLARGNNDNGPSVLLNGTSGSSGYTTAAGFPASGGTNAVASATPGAFDASTSTFFGAGLSLDPLSAYSVIVNGVSLGSRSTLTGPNSLLLYASTDGFNVDFESLGSVSVLTNGNWAAVQFDSLFFTINPGETLSLRLYGSDGIGTSSVGNWRIDDLAIVASPTPEPSVFALAGLGGLIGFGVLRLRRRAF